ncbi:ribosomal RNA small subunit methyltransferase NEP1 [Phlebotomus argentipes]|uniref:ribosomal RNA small subunit methyltransferase NEP1 n=1 Tax=Phlebotomus argentipes TaxID=94469 RepID=UPI0028937619|nr:ribosomal RNA small subunit methyltransferase NEP1 [Phlebotomus argentipes]
MKHGKKRKAPAFVESDDTPEIERKKGSLVCLNERKLIVVLEGAQLEVTKVGNVFELLNCDDHTSILRKHNRTAASCRPDITHQSLLMLLDSPLNRAGLLQVFIRTHQNVLIEINPATRIPRTFKRFAGMMVQLLNKFCIRADTTTGEKLLKVIKNPIANHLPAGCKKLTMSFTGDLVSNCRELVPKDQPIVVVIGAFAHGNVDVDYTEASVSISKFPLSAALTCTKLCSAFEEAWAVE